MTEPTKITVPWSRDGTKNAIPTTSLIGINDGRASYADGFVPLNGTPKAAGGIPPFKADFNGVLYDITNDLKFLNSGGVFTYDTTYQTAIGGYPIGALIRRADLAGYWMSTTDNNVTNPNSGGAGWAAITPIFYADAAGTTSAYTATTSPAFTALYDGLSVTIDTGAVGSNTTTAPNFSINGLTAYTIVNQGGVALSLGDLPKFAELLFDSTALKWVLTNPLISNTFATKLGVQQDTYSYAVATGTSDAILASFTPAITALTDGMGITVAAAAANGTTTPTLNVNGLGAVGIVKGNGTALVIGDIVGANHLMILNYSSALSKWVLQNPSAGTAVPVGAVLEYAGNGAAPAGYVLDGSVLSRSAYPALFALYVTNAGFTTQTFTCTIAAPGVFTKSSHGFTGGERLRLSTTGALPTGLNTTTDYFVEKIDANTFYLTTSVFGIATRITTSGTQSGTQTYLQSLYGLGDGSTTFNTPDIRGLFTRGLDGGRGIDSGRAMGTVQKGSIMPSDTNYSDSAYVVGVSTSSSITPLLTMGQDALNVNDYAGVVMLAASTYESYSTTMSSNGVARPSNIAVQHIIKY